MSTTKHSALVAGASGMLAAIARLRAAGQLPLSGGRVARSKLRKDNTNLFQL